jgi:hypothetical protein
MPVRGRTADVSAETSAGDLHVDDAERVQRIASVQEPLYQPRAQR